jgi:hypothetical protein
LSARIARTIIRRDDFDPEVLDWDDPSRLVLTNADGRATTRITCLEECRIAAMRHGFFGSARFDPSLGPGELTIRLTPR